MKLYDLLHNSTKLKTNAIMDVLQKKAKPVDENPFYKMSATLNLFQQGNKLSDTVMQSQMYAYLDAAWKECSDRVKKELFFSLVFSLGDITNREHNIFRHRGIKQVDQGGQSKRKVFYLCMKWMLERVPTQFYAFLPIIGEYYNLGGMFMYQLQTDRWKGNLKETLHLPVDVPTVTTHIANVLKNPRLTDNERMLWAKWLPHVPSPNRIRKYTITEKNIKAFKKGGHDVQVGSKVIIKKDKKQHTQDKDHWVVGFIKSLSEKMDWVITKHKNNVNFEGYRAFRKKYLAETEAAMFSQGGIEQMDKTQYFAWLDKLPSGARYRVACRVVSKDKSGTLTPKSRWSLKTGENLGQLYMDWVKSKEKAQTQLASLTEVQKKEMQPEALKQLKQAAKVNTGGDTMLDLIVEIGSRKLSVAEMDIKAFSLLEKMSIGVPVLVAADKSGSMGNSAITHKGVQMSANAMCQLATTIFLLKNPHPEAGEFFVRFGIDADVIVSGVQAQAQGLNKFMSNKQVKVSTLIDRTKPFSWNLTNVGQYITHSDGGTKLDTIATTLKYWVDEDPQFKSQKIDQINQYPVFLIISDGDLNSSYTPIQSFLSFQQNMRQWFGWEGVTVLWDVKESGYGDGKKFEGANNLMYFGGTNPGILDQIFRNISDLDVVDSFLPLKAFHSSNRYSPVRELVL